MKLTSRDRLLEAAVAEVERQDELGEEDLGPLVERNAFSLVPPKKGEPLFKEVTEDDGTKVDVCKVAVIRPCVSRGRRVRGLPPIYTPRMLERDAPVFKGWPMFMDHLTERMVETVKRRGRSIKELGGRMVETWWDPSFTTPEDEQRGFQPGGVLGYAAPQPPVRSMLEADPKILRCSINAWPTGAKPGKAPWGPSGMLIEGISAEPPGSVDWVLRDGAGGRVLQEDEDQVVALLESYYESEGLTEAALAASGSDPSYDSGHDDREDAPVKTKDKPNFAEMSEEEIRGWLGENAPDVLAKLEEEETPPTRTRRQGGKLVVVPAEALAEEEDEPDLATLVQEQVTEAVTALSETINDRLTEREEAAERRADELLAERDEQRRLRDYAHTLIKDADGLTDGWRARLKEHYAVLPTGATAPLLVEASEEETTDDLVKKDVEARVEDALKLIRETAGKPVVEELGDDGKPTKKKDPRDNPFIDFMMESAGTDDPEQVYKAIGEAVRG